MSQRKKFKQGPEPTTSSFVARVKRIDPSKAVNTLYFMSFLNSGEDSDFKIALKDTPNAYILVHSFILKVRSEYFKTLFNSNMKETSERQVTFEDFDDTTVMNALECIYSCSSAHMADSNIHEISALIDFLAYIQIRDGDEISELCGLINDKDPKFSAAPLLVVLEQVRSLNVANQQKLDVAWRFLATKLWSANVRSLGREGAESFCKLDEEIIRTLIELSYKTKFFNGEQNILKYVAVWTSYSPNQRISHTIKLIQSFSRLVYGIRPYTLPKGSKDALSMVDSVDLQELIPGHFETRPETPRHLICELEAVMLRLDHDSLVP